MSQSPKDPPEFDLSELDDVRAMAQKGLSDALDAPAAAPDMPEQPPDVPVSGSAGGGFDSSEEIIAALQTLNTSVQQVVQMLQRIMEE